MLMGSLCVVLGVSLGVVWELLSWSVCVVQPLSAYQGGLVMTRIAREIVAFQTLQ
jgi:hypothetical protein